LGRRDLAFAQQLVELVHVMGAQLGDEFGQQALGGCGARHLALGDGAAGGTVVTGILAPEPGAHLGAAAR
jgi:hypothetical protein